MKTKKILIFLSKYSVPLISGIVIALIWANLSQKSYQYFLHRKIWGNIDFHFLINDIFMVFFFAIAGVEIMHSILPGGHLNPIKKAVTPIMATMGGVLGPVAVFFILNYFWGSPNFMNGWAIPTATDIAISWLIARMVFGAGHPAISFLLLLAIADDAIGLAIIAIFYPDPMYPVDIKWLALVVVAMGGAYLLNRKKVCSYWPYLIVCGIPAWIGMLNAHLHPALSLVFIIPFLPHTVSETAQEEILLDKPIIHHKSTLNKFEEDFKNFIDFGLFFFGLANAGVKFANISELTYIIFLSLLIGKTCGIFLLTKLGVLAGYMLPEGINNEELLIVGVVASTGLTVALFVSGVAYMDLNMQGAAKMGALFSAFGGIAVLIRGKTFRPQVKYYKK